MQYYKLPEELLVQLGELSDEMKRLDIVVVMPPGKNVGTRVAVEGRAAGRLSGGERRERRG